MTQLPAPFRDKLDDREYTFDFIDAPYQSTAGPGVHPFFDGPYYTFFRDKTPSAVYDATRPILRRLRERQYDAVICFSQGCAVLSSLILHHQAEHPGEPLPFKGAVFICGGCPLYVLENWIAISEKAKTIAQQSADGLNNARDGVKAKIEAMLNSDLPKPVSLWDQPTALYDGKNEAALDPWTVPQFDPSDVFGLDLSSLAPPLRIDIPTVHIYGHRDPQCTSSLQLAMLCSPEKRKVYNHGGGHEIPRPTRVSEDIAGALCWLKEMTGSS